MHAYRSVISTGDVYNLHFIKNETVMSIQDESRNPFSIPLNSSLQFGLLYDPDGDTMKAIRGYSYRTIGDLATCNVAPRVIRARQTFNSAEPTSSVEAEEILIVKKFGCLATNQKLFVQAFSVCTRKYVLMTLYGYINAACACACMHGGCMTEQGNNKTEPNNKVTNMQYVEGCSCLP